MRKIALAALLMTALAAGSALAQVGGVTGIIVDRDGQPVESARVSLWSDGGCVEHVFTDAAGVFLLEDVEVGTYDLRAGKPHVGNVTLEDIIVVEGQITDVGILQLVGGGPHGGGVKFQFEHQFQGGLE